MKRKPIRAALIHVLGGYTRSEAAPYTRMPMLVRTRTVNFEKLRAVVYEDLSSVPTDQLKRLLCRSIAEKIFEFPTAVRFDIEWDRARMKNRITAEIGLATTETYKGALEEHIMEDIR